MQKLPIHCLPVSLCLRSISISISLSMAPRRQRKTGLTRMDAALDQMSSFGFSRQLVRKTVRNLLKLYGGDDGWKLIEEDGYRVLLDVILDEQEATQTDNLLKDASPQHENTAKELAIVESNKVAAEDTSFEENNNASLTNYAGGENKECWNDLALDETCIHKSPFHTGNDHSANKANLQDSEDPPLGLARDDTLKSAPTRRRKPCYGWISDDDNDEETYFITLTPAT